MLSLLKLTKLFSVFLPDGRHTVELQVVENFSAARAKVHTIHNMQLFYFV